MGPHLLTFVKIKKGILKRLEEENLLFTISDIIHLQDDLPNNLTIISDYIDYTYFLTTNDIDFEVDRITNLIKTKLTSEAIIIIRSNKLEKIKNKINGKKENSKHNSIT